jgi:pyridoxal phosphate enzyme (YggS family)
MVTDGLAAVRRRIAQAAERADRDPASVTLVAVSKGHSIEAIAEAYAAGQRDFGENRAQELADKVPLLPSDIRWHFIGTLQSRKVRLVRPHTSLLHSLDRVKLARAWAAGGPPPPALIQVNLADEPQKHGASAADVPALITTAAELGITCAGLMLMPPAPVHPEDSRRWFVELAQLAASLRADFGSLDHLSMGMTDDFEVAVEEGATVIRVGRAIFGPRSEGDRVEERGA